MTTPADELARRRRMFADELRRRKLDAFLCSTAEDVRYFTGYAGTDAWLLASARRAWLVTDFRFVEEAERTTRGCEIVVWKQSPWTTLGELAKKSRCRRVGFCAGHISVNAHARLRAASAAAGRVAWTPADELPEVLRAVKSPWEVARVEAAQRIAEKAFGELLGRLRAGMEEREVAFELDHWLRRHGAEESAFPTIVAADADASLPHARPGQRKIRAGGLLLIDFGARLDGYCSDATRTLFCGEPSRRWRERYAWVLAAQEAALAALGPEEGGRRAARAAAEVFAARGVEGLFGHGLGHGIGLAVHEAPRLAGAKAALAWNPDGTPARPVRTTPKRRPATRADAKTKTGSKSKTADKPPPLLSAGMVVTVEPGLYWPGSGGIRIEDMALVTPTGHRNLTRLPKNPEDVVF